MTDPQPPREEATRQRKLDDLFGDEPFLSPTMKARRLHESMGLTPTHPSSGASARHGAVRRSSGLELIPDVSDDEVSSLWRRRTETERAGSGLVQPDDRMTEPCDGVFPVLQIVAADRVPAPEMHARPTALNIQAEYQNAPAGPPIRFAQAAALFRSDCRSANTDGPEAMRDFRIDVLYRWLKKVPARDVDSAEEL